MKLWSALRTPVQETRSELTRWAARAPNRAPLGAPPPAQREGGGEREGNPPGFPRPPGGNPPEGGPGATRHDGEEHARAPAHDEGGHAPHEGQSHEPVQIDGEQ